MKKILVFHGNQPCLDISENNVGKKFGLNRDRNPDRDWTELRNTSLEYAKEVELTPELKLILLQDLAYAYGNDTDKFTQKLKEYELQLI